VPQDCPRAQQLLTAAAQAGVVSALTSLGRMHEAGGQGWPPDAGKAAELFFTAMERGDGAAANRMGELYLVGNLNPNPHPNPKAAELFFTAMERGDGAAGILLRAVPGARASPRG
jgi:TPR repeat protein